MNPVIFCYCCTTKYGTMHHIKLVTIDHFCSNVNKINLISEQVLHTGPALNVTS